MNYFRPKAYLIAAICLSLLMGFTAVSDIFFEIKRGISIFGAVYREISTNYVDEVDPGTLINTGIEAMLETLDPYTVIYDQNRNKDLQILTRGQYGGVGIEVDMRSGEIIVISAIEGTTAFRQGIQSGDIIRSIDGQPTNGLSQDEIQVLLAGSIGSSVVIGIERFGVDEIMEFTLIREQIEVKNLNYAGFLDESKGLAYVSLARFGESAALEIEQALQGLGQEKISSLILDLRNNPGGLLGEAVNLVDLFLPENLEVVRTRGRLDRSNTVYLTDRSPVYGEIKIVVLQNEGSASASEIVAGALQDHDRAVILGERSFGKGLVQIVQQLPFDVSLKITTARYYIPSGRSIQAIQYTHESRNAGRFVPDSLRKPFKTKNGRVVLDGAGIDPDVRLDQEAASPLLAALENRSHFMLFATRYANEHKSYSQNELEKKVLPAFREYLTENAFSYELESEFYLKDLEEVLKGEFLFADAKSGLERIQTALSSYKKNALKQDEAYIKQRLHLELTRRYSGSEDGIIQSLTLDPQVQKALEILENDSAYRQILSPK